MNDLLREAGDLLGLEPEEVVVISALCSAAGASVGVAYARIMERDAALYLIFGCLLGAIGPLLRIDARRQERKLAIERGVPRLLDLLCLSLSAGLDLSGSLRQVIEKSGQKDSPLHEELLLVLTELKLGKTRRHAFEMFGERNPLNSVKELVATMIQSEEEGSSLAKNLKIQAQVSRQHRSQNAEELSSKAGIKIILPVGVAMISVLLLIAGPLLLGVMQDLGS